MKKKYIQYDFSKKFIENLVTKDYEKYMEFMYNNTNFKILRRLLFRENSKFAKSVLFYSL